MKTNDSSNEGQENRFLVNRVGHTADKVPYDYTQFTLEGLQVLIEYYNQKYQKRGKTHHVKAIKDEGAYLKLKKRYEEILKEEFIRNGGNAEDYNSQKAHEERKAQGIALPKEIKDGMKDVNYYVDDVDTGLMEELKQQGGCHKVIFTIIKEKENELDVKEIGHSFLTVITSDKLILMRNDVNDDVRDILNKMADKLGLKFIQPKVTHYQIQGKYAETCHMLANTTAKDLTQEDLEDIERRANKSTDGFFELPPKALKYTQSITYLMELFLREEGVEVDAILESVDAKERSKKIKALAKEMGFKEKEETINNQDKPEKQDTPSGYADRRKNRIQSKMDTFQKTLNEVAVKLTKNSSIANVVTGVLDKYDRKRKEKMAAKKQEEDTRSSLELLDDLINTISPTGVNKPNPKKPLIIYIAETEHGDTSYTSITEQIIKDCDKKGLKVKIFSEFGNAEKGWGSEDEKSMVGYFPEDQINQFVNSRTVPMGNVFRRFTQIIPSVLEDLPEDITPSQLLELRRDQIDNPETLRLLEAEIGIRQQNEEGLGNSEGKEGEDFNSFWGNGNAFVQRETHEAMAKDVIDKSEGDEDVIIMIAGAPHIYGLNQALGEHFQDCQKLVVANFKEFEIDESTIGSIRYALEHGGKAPCEEVGEIAGFEVGLDKQAVIPSIISEALGRESKSIFRGAKEEDVREQRMQSALPRESELLSQFRPKISKDCFEKYFNPEQLLEEKDSELKNHLKNLFRRVLVFQKDNSSAVSLLQKIDHIDSQEDLDNVFAHIDLDNLRLIDRLWLDNKNNITPEAPSSFTQKGLENYIEDSAFSGSISLSKKGSVESAYSRNTREDSAFAIHSTGKLVTGILAIKMMQEGILKLDEIVDLDPEIISQLPETIQKHLQTVTLRQLMTHKSGLQNYLVNYMDKVNEALIEGNPVPNIQRPEDFLKFADDVVVDVPKDEIRYSNMGSLLTGLAIQTAYNKQNPTSKLSYDEILRKYVIEPSTMNQFSTNMPDNGMVNELDPVAPHIAGSPAGGYWTDCESLNNFGQWICQEWKNPEFQRLVKDHGQEFYDPERKTIAHGGSIESSCAFLTVFPDEEVVFTALSNRPLCTHVLNEQVCEQLQDHFNSRDYNKLEALDLAMPEKPSTTVEKSSVEKMADLSKKLGGSREI